jgi:hypothetical protein
MPTRGAPTAKAAKKSASRVRRPSKKPKRTTHLGRIVLQKVTRNATGRKKYTAHFLVDGRARRTQFGARGYSDYTLHHDRDRRAQYRARHEKDLKTGDPTRAGYLSYHLLWGASVSLARNVAAYKRMVRVWAGASR